MSAGGISRGLLVALLALAAVTPGAAGAENGAYQRGFSFAGEPELDRPTDVAVGPQGRLYVVDSGNDRIQAVEPDLSYLADWGSTGSGPTEFDGPLAAAVDDAGNVYIADRLNDRVKKYDASGALVTTWGGSGSEAGQFDGPAGIAVTAAGTVVVADEGNDRIQRFDSDGQLREADPVIGASGAGDQSCLAGLLEAPHGVAVDAAERIYVTNLVGDCVQVFAQDGTFIAKWGSHGALGIGDPVTDLPGRFSQPRGIGIRDGGEVYVADTANSRVQAFRVFDEGGNPLPEPELLHVLGGAGAAPGEYDEPTSVSFDGTGRLVVADRGNDRVQFAAPDGADPVVWGHAGSGFGFLAQPSAIAVDDAGDVYVAEAGAARVQKFGPEGRFLQKLTSAEGPDGIPAPVALAVGPVGDVYVANGAALETRVVHFDASGGVVGSWTEGAPEGPSLAAPRGVAVDAVGDVYVADADLEAIFRYGPGGAWKATIGSPTAPSEAGPTAPAGTLRQPTGLAIGPDGRLYVVDDGNQRVQVFDPGGEALDSWPIQGGGATAGIAVGEEGEVTLAGAGGSRCLQRYGLDGAFLGGWCEPGAMDAPGVAALPGHGLMAIRPAAGAGFVQAFAWSPSLALASGLLTDYAGNPLLAPAEPVASVEGSF